MFINAGVTDLSYASDTGSANHVASLLDESVRELMDIEVTSVSKKAQPLSEATSAIFVITREDIRRSGETSIPELLRMVPGLNVMKTYSGTWEVSSRGIVGPYSNKLLVLVDGRSVYLPVDAEVIWNQNNIILEDIDRIEVIRGPGATMWGANAVNGVINIITKKADETQGALLSSSASSQRDLSEAVRFGGKLGENTYYRIYAKYQRPDNMYQQGVTQADAYERAGFRLDHYIGGGDRLTVLGEVNEGLTKNGTALPVLDNSGMPAVESFDRKAVNSGRYLLARWKRTVSATSSIQLQAYYDYVSFDDRYTGSSMDLRGKIWSGTSDFDFQHRFALGEAHDLLWGLGVRSIQDGMNNTFYWSFYPDHRDTYIYSAFIQDDIQLVRNRLKLILGTKLEYNSYSGFEPQPNIRTLWTPSPEHTLWAAVSRAARTPNRVESDSRYTVDVVPSGAIYPGAPSAAVQLTGNRDFRAEDLVAYEIGYRVQPVRNVSLDLTGFYDVYTKLRTFEPGSPEGVAGYLVLPYNVANKMSGKSIGFEMAVNWQVIEWWRLQTSFAYLNIHFRLDSDSNDTLSTYDALRNPHKKIMLRSMMDLGKTVDLDTSLYYTDGLHTVGLKSYADLNVRIGWRPAKKLELSITGQNLLDKLHAEFPPSLFLNVNNEVQRSVTGKVTWNF